MEIASHTVGPLQTNVHLVADDRTGDAIAIDTATPCLAWLRQTLAERRWRLRLIVSTHGHWDHIGDNAAVQDWTRDEAARPAAGVTRHVQDVTAEIAVHPLDAEMLRHPVPLFAPFEIPPSVPAVELAEGGRIRYGSIDLRVLHTPGHTEGSVCLHDEDGGVLFSGDTLFASGWGRTDLPGGSDEEMVESLIRLSELDDRVRVLPGHGAATTIASERPWLSRLRLAGLPF